MKKIFALLILLCINENPGFAHGVGFREISMKSVSLEFFYSTGEKMSYCDAKVFSPNDSKFAVQSGRTDEQGRFSFIPDTEGEWKIIVNDAQGHQCEAKIKISEDKIVESNEISFENSEIFFRALLGVSLIFNFALLIKIKKYAYK